MQSRERRQINWLLSIQITANYFTLFSFFSDVSDAFEGVSLPSWAEKLLQGNKAISISLGRIKLSEFNGGKKV